MLNRLYEEMVSYEAGCPKRIQHFVKVHSFARHIGLMEGLDEHMQLITEAAALVHDIGIKPALEKYGSDAGPLQEKEGIEPAREMLLKVGFAREDADRAAFLVGHHHTFSGIDGIDYQILVEADFLVNIFEGGTKKEAIEQVKENIFRTQTGTKLLCDLFL